MIGTNNQPALYNSTGITNAPQELRSLAVQEIVADAALNNTGKNRTPRRIIRTRIDGNTPDTSGISVTSAAPPYGGLWSPRLDNIRKSTPPIFRKYNELNAAVI